MHQTLPGIVPLYTAAEIRTVDRLTVEEVGLPAAVLMERAGLGAAAEIIKLFPDARRVAVLCGVGNNGGDGFVIARHLAATGRAVDVLLTEAESKVRRESKVNLLVARNLGIPVERVNTTAWKRRLREYDVLVDAMLGTGVSGAPRPNMEVVMRAIEASGRPVVAIDVPTGVDASTGSIASTAVRADVTLTFHGPKIGLAVAPGRFHAGRVKVVDIGIPPGIEEPLDHGIATAGLLAAVPPRKRGANKYDVGTVLCVGGAVGMAGAVSLATQGAARAGAGVVWGAVPEPIAVHLDAAVAEVQFRGAPADAQGRLALAATTQLDQLAGRADAVVLGPGIGDGDGTPELARWAVRSAGRLVLDAQGITAFAGSPSALGARDGQQTLLTPHEGELARLLGVESEAVRGARLESAQRAAAQTRCVVLLKGEDTIVAHPDGRFLVCRSDPSAATAGTGDVLAGVAGALLARGLDAFTAGACAATACGLAAESAARSRAAVGVVASDLLEHLPAAFAGRTVDGGGA